MKHNKILSLAALLLGMAAEGQAQVFQVFQKDGRAPKFQAAAVDSLSHNNAEGLTTIHLKDGLIVGPTALSGTTPRTASSAPCGRKLATPSSSAWCRRANGGPTCSTVPQTSQSLLPTTTLGNASSPRMPSCLRPIPGAQPPATRH